jgi:hypothetical protein
MRLAPLLLVVALAGCADEASPSTAAPTPSASTSASAGVDAGPPPSGDAALPCPTPPFDTEAPEFAGCTHPQFFTSGYGQHRLTSRDGITWENEAYTPIEEATNPFPGNDGFAIGAGYVILGSNNGFFRSADGGVTWKRLPQPLPQRDRDLNLGWFGFVGKMFLILAPNGEYTPFSHDFVSYDGEHWQQTDPIPLPSVRGVAYGNGVFLAVGATDDACGAGGPAWTTSVDGVTWTKPVTRPGHGSFRGVVFANGRFFATGDNTCNGGGETVNRGFRATFTDGKSANDWADASTSTNKFSGVREPLVVGNQFVVFSNDGYFTSADGKDFQKVVNDGEQWGPDHRGGRRIPLDRLRRNQAIDRWGDVEDGLPGR